MLRNILLASFLIGSACAMHLEYLKVDSDELLDGNLISDIFNDFVDQSEDLPMTKEQIPVVCWACKWVMKKVKKHLGNHEKAESIRAKLKNVCDKIGLAKTACKKMIDKNMDILVDELSSGDDPATICVNAGLCKAVGMLELIQALPQVYQEI
ncbi:antimicrobial peptide NK-lysin-like isoform X1 [Clarias gariepinus]|uniref:antimicrobial peptide NK-lysin-like isoform X1 n=1 Tax=Clarias gariepinus TaxID=13013 RepID=UPI00234CB3A6|nr:antimicrobial peptide NK-lysin-like isoform X1 [Clarias gariepinus]